MTTFAEFFRDATGGREPHPFQARFAEAAELPHLLRAPTGSGKTATAVLGWLYRWVNRGRYATTPRRLVYCLPMRVLVEQSFDAAVGWIRTLGLADEVEVHRLMGGVETAEWFLHPERPAVLIGTQDMLLSRALNRGYAATRFHWPIDFGLLNNDCLWVFDELQLMGSGVSTSAQLAGLRRKLHTAGDCCPTVWMSATMERSWLDTFDLRDDLSQLRELRPSPEELTAGELGRRMTAEKRLRQAPGLSTGDRNYAKALARAVAEKHQPGALTLVVFNVVDRAKEVFRELPAAFKAAKKELAAPLLIHSRFRPHERAKLNDALRQTSEPAGRVVVATQVVEAGVDVSARVLFTELAPWPSLVQRFGRCHRYGELADKGHHGEVYWIDVPLEDKAARPYAAADLERARGYLTGDEPRPSLEGADVSPTALEAFQRDHGITLPFEHAHVLRRRDLLDLFDTAPDLSGNDIDVSRFVRGDDPETDVQVFWRETPPSKEWNAAERRRQSARREELCNVPIGSLKTDFLKAGKTAYRFDQLDGEWQEVGEKDAGSVVPGQTFWVVATQGGYDAALGWSPASGPLRAGLVLPLPEAPGDAAGDDAAGADPLSETPHRRTLVEHTDGVCVAVGDVLEIVAGLLPAGWADHLRTAARWHDAGKAHPAFQAAMRTANPALAADQVWAKSGGKQRLRYGDDRKHFRHELASALAALGRGQPFEVAYLIAAHHGKVRLSIRPLPGEEPPADPDALFALGVRETDRLPEVILGDGVTCPETELDLSPMKLGGGASWTARALALRDALGPFGLAYLEAILRAADQRVSNAERKGEAP